MSGKLADQAALADAGDGVHSGIVLEVYRAGNTSGSDHVDAFW